jgi:hypothetical protein
LACQGLATQGEEEFCAFAGAFCGAGFGADAIQVGTAFAEVCCQGFKGGDAEGDDAFLVAFAAD